MKRKRFAEYQSLMRVIANAIPNNWLEEALLHPPNPVEIDAKFNAAFTKTFSIPEFTPAGLRRNRQQLRWRTVYRRIGVWATPAAADTSESSSSDESYISVD